MLRLEVKIYALIFVLSGFVLLAGCAADPPPYLQKARSEGLTLEEKIQQLVYRSASREEVRSTFGYISTGYTPHTLSYTVRVDDRGKVFSRPYHTYMGYHDPRHPWENFRWVLKFDKRGVLYDYRRIPIDEAEALDVSEHWEHGTARSRKSRWHGAYLSGFKSLACLDREHCWVVGAAAIMLETTDGGRSWIPHYGVMKKTRYYPTLKKRTRVPITLSSVVFQDRMNGWVTAYPRGKILHTSNGGMKWESAEIPRSLLWGAPNLESITFASKREGWAVGLGGTILHTRDGGSTWTAQSSGTKASLFSVEFCDGERGWAVGYSWTILHTSDAGRSWHAQMQLSKEPPKRFPPSDLLTSVSAIDCDHVWVTGADGTIFHTEDGGTTWRQQTTGVTEKLNAVQFMSRDKGWVVGDRGTILKTIDGGNEWLAQSSGTVENLYGLSFVDEDHGWIGGSYGIILHTTDGGTTWTKQCIVYDCAGEAADPFYWHPWLKPDSSLSP